MLRTVFSTSSMSNLFLGLPEFSPQVKALSWRWLVWWVPGVQTTHCICFCYPHCLLHVGTRGASPGFCCCSYITLLSSLCQVGISKFGGACLLSVEFLSFRTPQTLGNPFLHVLQDGWWSPPGCRQFSFTCSIWGSWGHPIMLFSHRRCLLVSLALSVLVANSEILQLCCC